MRIAIVNDMVMVVELLKRIVTSSPEHKLAWVAYDGAEAVRRCAADVPDLILMDLIMPVMGGVEATCKIMQTTPCAILIVTASVVGNIGKVFEAMGHGALDVVKTPTLGSDPSSASTQDLLTKIDTINKIIGKGTFVAAAPPPKPKAEVPETRCHPLVVLGASTGGPLAIAQIISQLPSNFPASVIVIQHVDSHFTDGFVRWLGERAQLPVAIAEAGSVPQKGKIFVAGTNDHLVVTKGRKLSYTDNPKGSVYRPSVDVFFESVSEHWPTPGIAVLLTGMGRDGASGLSSLLDAGWHTIAQRRDTCVVYGMPKAAIELNAASEVLPLQEIAASIVSHLCSAKRVGTEVSDGKA